MTIRHQVAFLFLGFAFVLFAGCDSGSDSTTETDTTTEDTVVMRTLYLLSNAAGTNSVLAYTRDSSGALTFLSETPTGGSGSGDNLTSTGNAIVLDTSTGLLFCVNAGSNSVSLFLVYSDGTVALLDTQNSRGVNPVSLAVYQNLVYVLNAGDGSTNPSIAGFQVSDGGLYFIEGSHQNLSTLTAAPTQIDFAPTGTVLALSEADSNQITSFLLDSNFAAYSRVSVASSGEGPAGIDFTSGGVLVCADGNPSVVDGGGVSSYQLTSSGNISVISSSTANNQTATSGVKVLAGGNSAVVSNSGSDSLSWYSIGSDGQINFTGTNVAAGDEPTELAASEDEAYLYVLNRESDSISAYEMTEAGFSLAPISGVDGLPSTVAGLTGW